MGGEGDEIDSITDSMNMNLSKVWEIVEDRGVWCIQSMRSQRVRHDLVIEQLQHLKSEDKLFLLLMVGSSGNINTLLLSLPAL